MALIAREMRFLFGEIRNYPCFYDPRHPDRYVNQVKNGLMTNIRQTLIDRYPRARRVTC